MNKIVVLIIGMLIFFGSCSEGGGYADGKRLYDVHCQNCHMEDGTGLGELIPPLAKADMLQQSGALAACWVRNGLEGEIVVNGVKYDNVMPANEELSEVEINNILNYINNAWGNERAFISPNEVEEVLKACSK